MRPLILIYFVIFIFFKRILDQHISKPMNKDPTLIGKILHQPHVHTDSSQADDYKCTKSSVRTADVYTYCTRRRPPIGVFGCMVQLYISQDFPASHSCF